MLGRVSPVQRVRPRREGEAEAAVQPEPGAPLVPFIGVPAPVPWLDPRW